MAQWEVKNAVAGSDALALLLEEGWEPFAVVYSPADSVDWIYLRRYAKVRA